LLNIFKGDALYALTQLYEVDVRYESYTYNNEDNMRERLIKTKKEKRPEFVFMASIGEPEIIQILLKSFTKEDLLRDMGSYYRVVNKVSEYRSDVKKGTVDTYVALIDNILFVTNNENLMIEHLQKGYPKNLRLPKELRADMMASNLNIKWRMDAYKSIKQSQKSILPRSFEKGLQELGYMFSNIEVSGFKFTNEGLSVEGIYEMNKKLETNSLFSIVNMLGGLNGDIDPNKILWK